MSMVGQQAKGANQQRMKQPGLSTMHENEKQINKPHQQTYKPDSMDQIPKTTSPSLPRKSLPTTQEKTQEQKNSNNTIPSTTQSSLETNTATTIKPTCVKDMLAQIRKEKEAANADGSAPQHHTGKIRITVRNHIKDSKMAGTSSNKTDTRMQSIIEQHRKSQLVEKRPSEILPNIHQPGWLLQRTCVFNTDMPINKKWSRVPVGLLPKLRKVVKKKVKKFVKKKEDSKLQTNMQHFRELDTRAAAYTQPLMNQFLAVSSAYSCATPDNRIRLQVENLEKIQSKDEKLREIDDQMAKRGGGDGGRMNDSRMKSMKNNNSSGSREMHNNNNTNGINKTNNNNTQNNNNNQANAGLRQRPEFNQSALDTIRKSLGRKSLGKKGEGGKT